MTAPSQDPAQILTGLLQAGQDFMRQWASAQPDTGSVGGGTGGPPRDFFAASQELLRLQRHALEQMTTFWTNIANASPDRRFAAEAWRSDPRFDLVRRTYLAYAKFLADSVESAQVDEQAKDQLRFSVGQFVDAMSPSNFLATNPEAMQLAIETGGQSLTEGLSLFFQDLAKGRVSMTDERAFEVGRNLAVTPGAVVFENELIQLIQYAPATRQVYERPLVIIPPCVNKFYILDLQPENSFVRHALAEGHTVFVASWRQINPALGRLTWDDYLEQGVLKALDVAHAITGQERVNALGFCVGGTLLACALAVLATRGERRVESLTLLTTMLDFTDTGELGSLVSEQSVAAREAAIGQGGILPGREMAFIFSSLRANDLIWQYVVNSYLKGKAPPAFDLLHWNADSTNLPGPMVCWFVRNTYLENKLREPGKTVQCGMPIDLGEIDAPAYVYASREDHIVPWQTAYRSGRLLSGPVTFTLGASGHIAGVINPPAKGKRNYWIDGYAGEDPERWLASARSVPGSWWPHWSAWLGGHAGEHIPARKRLGNRKYKRIEPAPGRYVMVKAE